MKKWAGILMLVLGLSGQSFAQCLVWQDEFNTTSLDLSKWAYTTGNGCGGPSGCGFGNGEMQNYAGEVEIQFSDILKARDVLSAITTIIDKSAPPGAEGADQGNGKANQYMDTSAPSVPLDSKLSPDEEKVLKEATIQRSDKQVSVKITVTDANKKPAPKKKEGFFKRLFGGGKKDNN